MRLLRFLGWIIRACNPLDPKNHWTWGDCYRHAQAPKKRTDRTWWFPKTEKESTALQIHLMRNGWIRLTGKQIPIPGMGGRTDRYLEFNLDEHTFTWDNWLIDYRNVTLEQMKAKLPVIVTEYEP